MVSLKSLLILYVINLESIAEVVISIVSLEVLIDKRKVAETILTIRKINPITSSNSIRVKPLEALNLMLSCNFIARITINISFIYSYYIKGIINLSYPVGAACLTGPGNFRFFTTTVYNISYNCQPCIRRVPFKTNSISRPSLRISNNSKILRRWVVILTRSVYYIARTALNYSILIRGCYIIRINIIISWFINELFYRGACNK